ncbi:MAG TPA: kelch repeat-containing protein, partial [Verrucomicrobiae bacterium]|nr:kelch repeat-containing protein [Verrucomicrobiae bacterium]
MKMRSGKFNLLRGGAIGLLSLFMVTLAHAGSFAVTSEMNSSRSDFTATTLPNGKVLVAGGLDVSGYLASAELFDPATAAWTTTGALNLTRDGHTATLLANGKVLVVGGVEASDADGESLASAELYDPATGEWAKTGSLKMARRWHTATLLADGRVLVVGGYNHLNGFISTAELYDPKTGKWSLSGKMQTGRRSHTATLLADGRLLVAGGLTRLGNLANAELYNPATGNWVTAGAMSVARKYHTATLLPNGKVL